MTSSVCYNRGCTLSWQPRDGSSIRPLVVYQCAQVVENLVRCLLSCSMHDRYCFITAVRKKEQI